MQAENISIEGKNGWDDQMLHHAGVPQDYVDGAPKGYTRNMEIEKDPEGKTWRERLDIEASEVKAQGIIDARAAEHQKDSVAHRTLDHEDGHITPYVDLGLA
jgi:hypothetical protein|tara:strand:+ start:363 stop:668 length:306 start_codon:yes stop_codon:yes gene_type:complete